MPKKTEWFSQYGEGPITHERCRRPVVEENGVWVCTGCGAKFSREVVLPVEYLPIGGDPKKTPTTYKT